MGVLNDFFDTYLPFFKPLVNFLWDNLKPYMPILQSVLDAIYSVVYSIISGLANLPSWLGGGFFSDMLSKLTVPSKGGGGGKGGGSEGVNTNLMLSIISGEINEKPILSVVGKNRAEVTAFDTAKKPMLPSTIRDLNGYISDSSNSMEVPQYAQNIQKGIESIGEGIKEMVDKLDKMERNIIGSVSGNKSSVPDKQFELSKLMSSRNFNGSKI